MQIEAKHQSMSVDDIATAFSAMLAGSKEEASRQAAIEEAAARGEPEPRFDGITLRQRLVPLIDMLRRSGAAGKEVVWGV